MFRVFIFKCFYTYTLIYLFTFMCVAVELIGRSEDNFPTDMQILGTNSVCQTCHQTPLHAGSVCWSPDIYIKRETLDEFGANTHTKIEISLNAGLSQHVLEVLCDLVTQR